MALTTSSLKNRIITEIEAVSNFPATGENPNVLDDRLIEALAKAIVEEIQANAVVIPDTLNNPSGQPVVVNLGNGVGSTTAPQTIAGTGKIQ